MTEPPRVRVLAADLAGVDRSRLVLLVRSLSPDVVVLRHAPRWVRWRTRGASLADRCGLVVAGGGGRQARGNLVLVSLRVAVCGTWSVRLTGRPGWTSRAVAFVQAQVAGHDLIIGGAAVGTKPEAAFLAKLLAGKRQPVLVAAAVAGGPTGPAGRLIAGAVNDVGALDRTSGSSVSLFVSPTVAVIDLRPIGLAGSRTAPVLAELTLGEAGTGTSG